MWDKSGRKQFQADYREGKYHGAYIWFYESGVTNKLQHYSDNEPIGRWVHFYDTGQRWEERFFSAPGIPDGDELVWNTNGAVTFKRTWRKGEPWDGRFALHKGTNWFREVYDSGKLVSSTNLGPLPPWAYLPPPARARTN